MSSVITRPPKHDYASLIVIGMPFEYEIGKKVLLNKYPRWDYLTTSVGWIDHGKTGLTAEAEVLSIQDDLIVFTLLDARGISLGNQRPNYVIPLNEKNKVRGPIYNPYQWEWDGFFRPCGGWDQYLPIKEQKVCSCGAEALARMNKQPITGHGVLCQKWQPNPYTR